MTDAKRSVPRDSTVPPPPTPPAALLQTTGVPTPRTADVSAVIERVDLWCDLIARAALSTAAPMTAAQLAATLAQLDDAAAVQMVCNLVLSRSIHDLDGCLAAITTLFARPLTPWQSNTVHQMMAMAEVQHGRYTAALQRIENVLGEAPPLTTPKVCELLMVQANAWRGLNDRAGYETALARVVHYAEQLGKPYAAQTAAELARIRSAPWEHLDPEYAARVQSRIAWQQRQEQEQLAYVARMPYQERQLAVPLVMARMQEQLAGPRLTPAQRHLLSSSYERLLHVLRQPCEDK